MEDRLGLSRTFRLHSELTLPRDPGGMCTLMMHGIADVAPISLLAQCGAEGVILLLSLAPWIECTEKRDTLILGFGNRRRKILLSSEGQGDQIGKPDYDT